MNHLKSAGVKAAIKFDNVGYALLRDCLKIANYYVRYRDLSDILRCNLLTQAARSTQNKSWQSDL
jgi:hypothetical protein